MTATEFPSRPGPAEAEPAADRAPGTGTVMILACGALARELGALVELNHWDRVTVEYLPAELHNRPERITPAVEERLQQAVNQHDRILLGYADCGTGGELDRLCRELGVERLPGAHCYQFFAGLDTFERLHGDEIGTLYLTDYLARHFDRLIIRGLGIEDHPELEPMYFGNYTGVVHLIQGGDTLIQGGDTEYRAETARRAAAAAERLGLPLRTIETGYGALAETAVRFVERPVVPLDRPSAGWSTTGHRTEGSPIEGSPIGHRTEGG